MSNGIDFEPEEVEILMTGLGLVKSRTIRKGGLCEPGIIIESYITSIRDKLNQYVLSKIDDCSENLELEDLELEEKKIKSLFEETVRKRICRYLEDNKDIKGGFLDELDNLLAKSSFVDTERHDEVLKWGSEFISSKFIVEELRNAHRLPLG